MTKPGELDAATLDAACTRIEATLVFASPAAITNVVATATGAPTGLRGLRLVLSAGAPVPAELLASMAELTPDAELHTPYGMTEALPVADIDLTGIERAESERAGTSGGVCVGLPVPGAEVRIAPLGLGDDVDGQPTSLDTGSTGEILVRAAWVSDGYDGLWATQRAARPGDGSWHRSGDVGHLDPDGRLWVEGRTVHVVDTVDGPVTPVPVERQVERALGVRRAAAVGVGPAGCQQLVVVLEDPQAGDGPVDAELADRVRDVVAVSVVSVRSFLPVVSVSVVSVPVAAVLTRSSFPVDIRHNAKIDRTALAAWASRVLAGDPVRRLGRRRRGT